MTTSLFVELTLFAIIACLDAGLEVGRFFMWDMKQAFPGWACLPSHDLFVGTPSLEFFNGTIFNGCYAKLVVLPKFEKTFSRSKTGPDLQLYHVQSKMQPNLYVENKTTGSFCHLVS